MSSKWVTLSPRLNKKGRPLIQVGMYTFPRSEAKVIGESILLLLKGSKTSPSLHSLHQNLVTLQPKKDNK